MVIDGNANWSSVQKKYNSLRDSGKTHDDSVKRIQEIYNGIGPGNQKRLADGYKKQEQTKPVVKQNIISTLDIKTIEKGGGDWGITGVNLKRSKVDRFQNYDVVKCVYEKNSGTSSDPGIGGFSFSAAPKGLDNNKISFSWDVYYPKGFKFAKGGKHGGPFIGEGAASGYQHSSTGSSNRIMWQENGGIIAYIYPPEGVKQDNKTLVAKGHGCGFFEESFVKALKYDQWNSVEIGTKMNTFSDGKPNADGECRVTINGKTETVRDVVWSRKQSLNINRFDWNTFFGGPDASPVTQVSYFKNFQMKKY